MNTPTLHTDRLTLRAFTEADLDTFSQYRARPEVAKYQGWSDYSYSDALSLFNNTDYANFAVAGQWYQLAIADSDSDHLLGDLAVHFIDEQQVEIGFTVAPENQQKHLAREAVTALLAYLFGTLNRHRVTATTDTENTASYRLLESLGFRREAHFRKNIFFKGAWGDEYQYALLSTEQTATQHV
ncbi:RimJ/RimL family protein N-acetyltransferase [Sinobacterium caligoides]|uniref:RimJ/RimL family protein N-acetyltransferase n=1 Tax=Sinobacterium caligoides TaxID=933926 RepID=A0A3N2DQF9_9GAMM|nr:GNAT family protein [Sinobacterium caligoides]ROS02030.1 RimJ/RimL family protein N-acetyltransferase [Sinobacterium caligoides]